MIRIRIGTGIGVVGLLVAAAVADDGPPTPPMYVTNRTPSQLAATLGVTTNGGSYSGNGAGLTNMSVLNIAGLSMVTNYSFITNATWNFATAKTATASTFSAWGWPAGQVSTSFNGVAVSIYPFDPAAVPTSLAVTVRIQGQYYATNSAVSPTGATNPATWTVLGSQTQTGLTLTSNAVNFVNFEFPSAISSTSNLWVEISGNGHFGQCQVGATAITNEHVYARTEYQTTGTLGSTNWVTSTGALPQFMPWMAFLTAAGTVTSSLASSANAVQIGYANAASGLGSGNVQGAIDLLAANQGSAYAVISLPVTNYAVVGTEMNLYWDNVVRSQYGMDGLWIQMNCATGFPYSACFRVPTNNLWTGVTPLSFTVGRETNVLASYNGYLNVSAATTGNGVTRKMLLIGDSTSAGVDGIQTVSCLWTNQSTNGFKLTFVGTQGTSPTNHEAHSGYTLNAFYTGASAGGSPFTNGAGGFDFASYTNKAGFAMASGDWVVVNLGINDVFSQTTDAGCRAVIQSFTNQLNSMVSNIAWCVPGIRVGLCVTIPPTASQDAFCPNYSGPGAQNYSRYRRNRFLLAETLCCYNQAGVYIWPINEALDTIYNMAQTVGPPNARNPATNVVWMTNGVHPATPGYCQISDAYWAILKGFEN